MDGHFGGEGGIRTLDGLLAHTPLAGERLQPLGHLSVALLLAVTAFRRLAAHGQRNWRSEQDSNLQSPAS